MLPGLEGAETNPPPKAEETLKAVGDEGSVSGGQARGARSAVRAPGTGTGTGGSVALSPNPSARAPEPGSRGAGPRESRAPPCCAAAPLRGPGALPGSQAPPGQGLGLRPPRGGAPGALGKPRPGPAGRRPHGAARTRAAPQLRPAPGRPPSARPSRRPCGPNGRPGAAGASAREQYLQGRGRSAAPPAPAAACASSRAPQAPPPRGRDFRGARPFVGGAILPPRPLVGGVTRRSAPCPGPRVLGIPADSRRYNYVHDRGLAGRSG
ncbi:translation initiation factor IF-2-like [Canis lupus familiaris]|uniref:translation initiation factor IF-2-like n=1 Tax=Canis lupus familiaris TaxID=9615 RepID=UPI0006B3C468|nr:translation initiation factor IF-2-like [Canis lupus familiaris]|eukprot:XP_013965172.1 uncharacterized protein LOC106558090 [Canis lupus familiaris]